MTTTKIVIISAEVVDFLKCIYLYVGIFQLIIVTPFKVDYFCPKMRHNIIMLVGV